MFRNMATSLFKYDRIMTTDVKAKELSRWADKLITLAKRGDLHARRQVMSVLTEKKVAHKLFAEAKQRYGMLEGHRHGDTALMSIIELVASEKVSGHKKSKKEE